MKIKQALFSLAVIFVFCVSAYAKTDLELTTNTKVLGPFVSFVDIESLETDIEKLPNDFFRINSDVIPNGFALANTLGYPNGKSTIGKFPHFEAGAAVGVSVYKVWRYRDFDLDKDNPSIPGGGVNGGFHVGTGITDRIDISVKYFTLNWFSGFYQDKLEKDKEFDNKSINGKAEVDARSFGIKARYNLVKESSPYSVLFNFGGVSINLAFDYLKNKISASGIYAQNEETELSIKDPFSDYSDEQNIQVKADLNGSMVFQNSFYSLTPEILAYFDVLYFITLYTGPSVSFVMGSSDLTARFDGSVSNENEVVMYSQLVQSQSIAAGSNLASAVLVSDNVMNPMRMVPKWALGLEFNLWVLKIQVEAATLLTRVMNYDTFTAQFGIRLDI